MTKQKVSIIVPVYNVENYLKRCLDSLINQTYKDLEIILIDDGSKDNSGNICDSYEKKDKRIKVIHKKNGGLSSARNAGLSVITGKFVMFVDSDDYIDTKTVDFLLNDIINTNSDISICSFYSVNGNEKTCPIFSKNKFVVDNNEKFYNLYNEYCGVTVSSCIKLFKADIFNELSYVEGAIHEDEIIILDILKKAKKISYNLEPLYYYEMRDGSITKKFDIRKLQVLPFMDKRINYFKQNGDKSLIEMTEYKKLHIMISLIEDFYNYKVNYSSFKELGNIRKEIKSKAIKCCFYHALSKKSRINSLIVYVLPLKLYSMIKKRLRWR